MAKKYVVIDKATTFVVAEGLDTRAAARYKKRELELVYQNETGWTRPRPSRYYVETDIEHPAGAGIYSH